jgi:hypothetical protein
MEEHATIGLRRGPPPRGLSCTYRLVTDCYCMHAACHVDHESINDCVNFVNIVTESRGLF